MKNKEQHYVPKFFLRRFSINDNQKTIGVFNMHTKQFIINAPLKSQSCKPYFYGRDGALEARLAQMEGLAAEVLRSICSTSKLPRSGTDDWVTLLVFLLSSELRTQTHIDATLDMGKQLSKAVFEDQKVLPKNIGDMNTSHEQAVEIAMLMIKNAFQSCQDLKGVLIKNETLVPFITSDNPVIKYNQYLERRKQEGGITGYALIGLQFFLPLDSHTMLMLYDPWVYKVGSKGASVIKTDSLTEIKALNMLSAVNCSKVLYFNQEVGEKYLNELTDYSRKYPKANVTISKSYYSDGNLHGQESFGPIKVKEQKDMLVHTYTSAPSINLSLRFISETKQAKKLRIDSLNFVKRPSCKMPQLPPSKGPLKFEYDDIK